MSAPARTGRSASSGDKILEVAAGFGVTTALDVLLALVGYLVVRNETGMIPPALGLAAILWLLQLVHVIPSVLAAVFVRRFYAVAGMVLAAGLCSVPSLVAMAIVLSVSV
ncbi:MAG: hypothetical protein M3Y87_06520 [Myxococcota bacterium]|nr:hypothetical protein [Myxococcota bacterium]